MRLLWLIIVFFACDFQNSLVEPDPWKYGSPADVGFNEIRLLQLDSLIKAGQYENINSLMIIKNENVIYEAYYDLEDNPTNWREKVDIGRSSLIFAALAIQIALEEQLIDSLQTPIYHLLPEYELIFSQTPEKQNITLENLLEHKSGLSWNEGLVSYLSPVNDINILKAEDDWTAYVLDKELEATPGIRYAYNSGGGMIISKIITNLTSQTMEDYLEEKIFRQLDLNVKSWEQDPNGITNGVNGLEISLFEFAKIGSVYLNEGKWNNQFIIDPIIAGEAIDKKVIYGNVTDLGYFWWRFSDNWTPANILSTNDTFFFPNENGDILYVIPHENLIIAIGAENLFYGFYNPSLILYFELLRSLN